MKDDRRLIRALPHIRLQEANAGKRDAVWDAYQGLCQTYVTHFCTIAEPDGLADLVYESHLSARWQRVAVQQAAGLAQSWRTNRRQAAQADLAHLAWYNSLPQDQRARQRKPTWKELTLPELKSVCIQANVNGVKRLDGVQLDASVHSQFDDWLQMATLIKRQPVYLPVRAL